MNGRLESEGREGCGRGHVVVGLSPDQDWQSTLDWAVEEAVRDGRVLTLVHAVDVSAQLWRDPVGHQTRVAARHRPSAARLLVDEARAHALARAPGLAVHEVVHRGGPTDVLTAVAADAHLLVIGAHDRHGLWPRLVPGVGAQVTRRPPCAVVVVHPTPAGEVRRGVVVGVDDPRLGDQGALPGHVRLALEQATRRGWPLTVLHVAPAPLRPSHQESPLVETLHRALAAAGVAAASPDLDVRAVVETGDPTGRLLRAGTTAGLVVVGAHAGRRFAEVLAGSVVDPVVAHSCCPVAVAPTRAA